MKKQYYYNQEVLFLTQLFGKPYFWMKDVDGTIYLVKAKSVVDGVSLDGTTGDFKTVNSGLVPDFGA